MELVLVWQSIHDRVSVFLRIVEELIVFGQEFPFPHGAIVMDTNAE